LRNRVGEYVSQATRPTPKIIARTSKASAT
jgi:hypothetical protein